MWRYFAIATAIVAAALAVILALPVRPLGPTPSPHYSGGRGTPGPAQRDDFRLEHPPVTGEAPWALSALPGCFRQRSSASGPPAFARASIPQGARLVTGDATLRVADCTLVVHAGWALVTRGDNRLRVPAPARFYVAGDRLILDRSDGGRENVRVYGLAGGVRPAFVSATRSPKPW